MNSAQETRAAQLENDRFSGTTDLLERQHELAAVEALIRDRSGGGRLLAIEGPPGIGKTTLLLEARRRAEAAGIHVLSARGSELERTFSFGIVRQLFEPFMVRLTDEEQDELLSGAAGLAAPVFEPTQLAAESPPDISLSMLHGLYWLTANVAARGPLVLVIDDLHLCDLASLRWLAYLLPRVDDLDLAIVAGLRGAEQGEDPALLGQIAADALSAVVRPAPLSPAAVARLLRETVSPGADDAFSSSCHDVTGGNPLLVHELVVEIVIAGLAPTETNVGSLRDLAARAGSRAVSVRLTRLPESATKLAQAVAVLGEDAEPRHAAALAGLDEGSASTATAALARVEVLRPQAPLGFVHPLIGTAVYETLTPLERERAHSRAAGLLAESTSEPERVAAHLLRVPAAGEPRFVSVLREAAGRARCRGAAESAVAYLQRALAEPPDDSERADVLRELGYAEALVIGDASVEHLREAHALTEEPIARAHTALMLGRQLFFLRMKESAAVFAQGLEELAGADPELERVLESGLITTQLFQPSLYAEGCRRLERIRARPADGTAGEKMRLALLAFHDARAGEPAAVAYAQRALADDALLRHEVTSGPHVLASIVLTMADLDEALPAVDAAVADAHRRGSVIAFATAKAHRAETLLCRGDLVEAEEEAREALAACDTWATAVSFPALLVAFLAGSLMEQGKLEEAAALLDREVGEPPPDSARPDVFLDRRARLRLLQGDFAGGLEEMLAAGRRFGSVGGRNPAFMPWRSQAALALLQLDRAEEARPLADEELELARRWGAPRALGTALIAAGLIEGGRGGLELLEEAVAVLERSPAKLEQAKARTELGAALRRSNHRAKAREQLRRAVELATISGASPLAARAESELLATGARPRRIALSGLESLTPSERRVAELAAEGPTNREIAQTLFVTPKTVEVHLSHAYRKLGISSRSQLAAALAEPAGA